MKSTKFSFDQTIQQLNQKQILKGETAKNIKGGAFQADPPPWGN